MNQQVGEPASSGWLAIPADELRRHRYTDRRSRTLLCNVLPRHGELRSPNGNLLKTVADGVGLPLTVTDPVGTVTANAYDSYGNLVSVVRDAGPGRLNVTTTSTFDARGDPLTVTDPRSNVTTNTWDAGRRLASTTTPATPGLPTGLVTAYTYDPAGKVLQTQQSANGSVLRTTSATYTASGKPATTTDPNGNVTRFAYDVLDRRTRITDPICRIATWAHDALSGLVPASNPAIVTGRHPFGSAFPPPL